MDRKSRDREAERSRDRDRDRSRDRDRDRSRDRSRDRDRDRSTRDKKEKREKKDKKERKDKKDKKDRRKKRSEKKETKSRRRSRSPRSRRSRSLSTSSDSSSVSSSDEDARRYRHVREQQQQQLVLREQEELFGPMPPPSVTDTDPVTTSASDTQSSNETRRVRGPELPPQSYLVAAKEMLREQELRAPINDLHEGQFGPSIPASILMQHQSFHEDDDDKDDGDDIIGPSLPENVNEAEQQAFSRQLEEIDARARPKEKEAEQPQLQDKSSRGDWMLVPPSVRKPGGDPMDIRSRTFSRSGRPDNIDQSSWTETPADREKRILQGVEKKEAPRPTKKAATYELSEKDRRLAEQVEIHNNSTRGKSLMEMHREMNAQKLITEDVSKRAFDWEKDMKIQGIDQKSKNEMVARAGSMKSRFGHGQSGAYL